MYSKLIFIDNDKDVLVYSDGVAVVIIEKENLLSNELERLNIKLIDRNRESIGSSNDRYKFILNKILMLPKDKLDEIKKLINHKE